MSGMLMQLAAATAVKGTRRPTKGGILFTMEFSPSHHTVHVDIYGSKGTGFSFTVETAEYNYKKFLKRNKICYF